MCDVVLVIGDQEWLGKALVYAPVTSSGVRVIKLKNLEPMPTDGSVPVRFRAKNSGSTGKMALTSDITGAWTKSELGMPPEDSYCIVHYHDNSIGAATAGSDWENGFYIRNKWTTPSGKRKFEDTSVPAKPIAWFIVPEPIFTTDPKPCVKHGGHFLDRDFERCPRCVYTEDLFDRLEMGT